MQSKRAAVESQVQHRLDEESRSLTGEIRDIENKIAEVKSLPTGIYIYIYNMSISYIYRRIYETRRESKK